MALPPPLQRISDYLQNRPDVRQILSNTGWLFSDRIIRLTLVLVVSSWVARYLGTEQYGHLSLAAAYVMLAAPVFKLGLDNIIVRRVVEERDARNQILGTAIVLRVAVVLVGFPLLLLITMWLHPDTPIIPVLVALLMVAALFESLEIIDFWFQAEITSKYTVWARNSTFMIITAARVFAILAKAPLLVFGILQMLDMVLFMLILAGNYQRTGESILRWRFNQGRAIKLLRESWVLILGGMAVSLYMRIDQVMLAQMLPGADGDAAVGVYSAAVRLSEAWYFVPGAIVTSTFSTLIYTKSQSETLYRARVQRLFKTVVLISYVFAISLTFFSGLVIDLLLGADYREATPMLIILAWAGVWTSLGVARNPTLHAENAVSISMQSTVAGAISNIVLNLILIPLWGALGCAVATLISQFIAAHLSTYFYASTRHIGKYQTQALFNPNPFGSSRNQESNDQ